jgi:hypothetical protein
MAKDSKAASAGQVGVIEVEVRTIYGAPVIYPVSNSAKVLAQIAGTKTLSQRNLELARDLGLRIVDVTPAPTILDRFKEVA